jgi:SAM-dependent methyltransferase
VNTTTLYDHPLYYDILFGWDRSSEAAFYHRLFDRAGVGADAPILEVACGTGQVARRLARLGRRVSGMDTSPRMLDFLAERASSEGVDVQTMRADMTTFVSKTAYGAAYNPMSSFRLIQTDREAEAHLHAIATALQVSGVYALDLTLVESIDDPEVTTDDEWEMSRDGITIRATNDVIRVDDGERRITLNWGSEAHLRNYTASSFEDRVRAVPTLRIESWYPEVARLGSESISTFNADDPQPHALGRAVVLLRRV